MNPFLSKSKKIEEIKVLTEMGQFFSFVQSKAMENKALGVKTKRN